MSRQAIAAVLARADLASGERLVALSLASFAGRDNRAWPGASAASARSGLSRSRYQQAREQLVARGLVTVDERTTGRGRASTGTLVFADSGPWWDGDINVELFEAVLCYTRTRGPARLLLATMAAVADEEGVVRDLSTEQLCAGAGIADRTYRRARAALLASNSIELVNGVGGRGNTNVWMVRDPRGDASSSRIPWRVAPPAGVRPLIKSAGSPGAMAQAHDAPSLTGEKGGHNQTLTAGNCPILTGVSAQKGGHDQTLTAGNCPILTGVSAQKGGQDQTLFELPSLETPAQTPAETPAPNVRAGKEPQNPRTKEHPPNPPEGGSSPGVILVEQTFVTPHGRTRHRAVPVDLDEVRRRLGLPSLTDRNDWDQIRNRVHQVVGDSNFEIWLEPLELIAIDPGGALVIDAPPTRLSWLVHRFGRVLTHGAEGASRQLRFADEAERRAFDRGSCTADSAVHAVHINQREVS
jgi:hypothetical protein